MELSCGGNFSFSFRWFSRPGSGARLLMAVAVVVLVAIAIGLGVGVPKSHTGNQQATVTKTITANPPPPTPTTAGIRNDSNIFSMKYPISVGSTSFRVSVYYQDEQGYIGETTLDDSSGVWAVQPRIAKAKARSPITALVWPADLAKSLFYLNDANVIVEQYWNTGSRQWGSSVLSRHSLAAHALSRLTSYTLPGYTADPAFVIYEDSSGNLMAAKSPLPGGHLDWTVSTLSTLGESQPGAGLALVPFGQSEAQLHEVRLFFQRPNGNLAMGGWDKNNDWQIKQDLTSKPQQGASLAATSFFSNNSNEISIDLVYPAPADSTRLLMDSWHSQLNWTTKAAYALPSGASAGVGFSINSLERIYSVVDGVLKEFEYSGGLAREISVVPTNG